MAKTQDYLDYLDDNISIAPANSQEELQASQLIADIFDAHGLEPTIQEFDVAQSSGFTTGVLMALLFVGMLLSGVGSTGLSVVGILFALVAGVLLIMQYMGNDVLESYGPVSRSQNVIGFHEATGPLAAKGNRPIVVVAHYDTPHEDLYSNPALAPYQGLLKRACIVCVPLCTALAFFQAFGFIPVVARRMLWLVGVLASLPVLVWGVTIISRRFMGCTPGANNNKSGVAAMLGVLNNLRPVDYDGVPQSTRAPRKQVRMTKKAAAKAAAIEEGPVRHGEEVLRSLGVLPEECEIVYEDEPEVVEELEETAEELPEEESAEEASEEPEDTAEEDEVDETPAEPTYATPDFLSGAVSATASKTEEVVDVKTLEATEDEVASADETSEAIEEEADDEEVIEVSEEASADDADTTAAEATETQDPNSTAASFRSKVPTIEPQDDAEVSRTGRSSASRRAILSELPDPSANEIDPLDTTTEQDIVEEEIDLSDEPRDILGAGATTVMPAQSVRIDTDTVAHEQQEVGRITPEDLNAASQRKRRGLFGRRRRQDEDSMSEWLGVDNDYDAKSTGRSIGSWDKFEEDDDSEKPGSGKWKGGATTNGRFRVIDGSSPDDESLEAQDEQESAETIEQEPTTENADEILAEAIAEQDELAEAAADDAAEEEFEDAPDENELREAILSMGDDALISHDIWFVALGASEMQNAGMDAFLAEYRKACRGAFLINLDCVGAGELSVYTQEGLSKSRKADRRLVRLLTETAADLHIELNQTTLGYGDTDATPAMRTSMRSATLTGLDENGLPAFAHEAEDVVENLDDQQILDVCTLVTEAIRRS